MGQIDLTKAKFEVVDVLYLEGDSLYHVTFKATNLDPMELTVHMPMFVDWTRPVSRFPTLYREKRSHPVIVGKGTIASVEVRYFTSGVLSGIYVYKYDDHPYQMIYTFPKQFDAHNLKENFKYLYCRYELRRMLL